MHTRAQVDALNSFEHGAAAENSPGQRGEKNRRGRTVLVALKRGLLQRCDNGLNTEGVRSDALVDEIQNLVEPLEREMFLSSRDP